MSETVENALIFSNRQRGETAFAGLRVALQIS